MHDARHIPALDETKPIGPQLFARFEVGDNVAHVMLGDGKVMKKEPDRLMVHFFRQSGDRWYNAEYFTNHPHNLFHRGTENA